MSTNSYLSLHELGLRHSADKSYFHKYTEQFYPLHLDSMRFEAETIIEIGIFSGASLKMWSEYFVNARIIGVDFDLGRIQEPIPRTCYRFADQSNRDHLKNALFDISVDSVDLIIDDAMHSMICQQTSLAALFPYVRPGRIYIVEDLQTSITQPEAKPTTLELLQNLRKGDSTKSKFITQPEMDYLENQIARIEIFSRTENYDESVSAVIYKKS